MTTNTFLLSKQAHHALSELISVRRFECVHILYSSRYRLRTRKVQLGELSLLSPISAFRFGQCKALAIPESSQFNHDSSFKLFRYFSQLSGAPAKREAFVKEVNVFNIQLFR